MALEYLRTQSHAVADEGVQSIYSDLASNYEKKLYHQFTDILLNQVLSSPYFTDPSHDNDHLLQLHNHVLKAIYTKLNPISYIQIVIQASKQLPKHEDAIEFLNEIDKNFHTLIQHSTKSTSAVNKLDTLAYTDITQAIIVVKSTIISRRLFLLRNDDEHIDDLQAVKDELDTLRRRLDEYSNTSEIDPLIHSSVYRACMEYYKLRDESNEYFQSALLYLTYTPLPQIIEHERERLAIDIGIAALLGQNIYNFGELLQHPLINVLDHTTSQWLSTLLYVFNNGNIDEFQKIYNTNKDSTPLLQGADKAKFLAEKVRIMALINYVFQQPSTQRTIKFRDISKLCQIDVNEVEWLLMKALSLKVIKGSIDQVEQQIRCTWVSPRVLDKQQIESLRDRLDGWTKELTKNITYLSEQGAELVEVR